METKRDLLALVHDIADPCEKIREGYRGIADDPETHPEIRQASQDMAEAIERVFQIASYLMAHPNGLR